MFARNRLGIQSAVGLLLLLAAGCGETKRDVIERYRAPCDQMRQRLMRIAAKLPPAGSVRGPSESVRLTPIPAYDAATGMHNVEILAEPELTGQCSEDPLPMFTFSDLVRCLLWTDPRRLERDTYRNEPAEGIEDYFQALTCEYLLVVRVLRDGEYSDTARDGAGYGYVDLEVFLIQGHDDKIVASFPVPVDRKEWWDDTRWHWLRPHQFPRYQDARVQTAKQLSRITGGRFRFDEDDDLQGR